MTGRSERRAARLLRWYPRTWRDRYGDEFAELLVAEIDEVPRSWRRAADVARSGLGARLAVAGLAPGPLAPNNVRASLASLACAAGGFVVIGTAIWSQLTIGWQWSRPDTPVTTAAVVVMSGVLFVLAALAVMAAIPIAWAVAVRRGHGMLGPIVLFLSGASALVLGAHHFASGWPGTGGHAWNHQHLVPGGAAAFAWAATLSISSYWAHPAALLAFPLPELAWMAVSPIAAVCAVVGAARTVLRLELSPRTLRFEAALARLACLAMLAFLAAPCCWILAGGAGPRNLFHAGAIDLAGVVAMLAALGVARRASTGLARVDRV